MKDRVIVALGFLAMFLFSVAQVWPQEDNCQNGAISSSCCCTNNCCQPVSSTEVEALPNDHWKILATGEELKRTGWSPDGTIIRCHCDLIDGKWTVHPMAKTRCIYIPLPNS